MPIEIKSTLQAKESTNILVYGESGVGKTTLCATVPKPLIISAEKGLMSISDKDLACVEVHSLKDIKEVYKRIKKHKDYAGFETICIDSISDIAEKILGNNMKEFADGRQAYGRMNTDVAEIIRLFRDLPHHVYFTAKCSAREDANGVVRYKGSLPGKTLAMDLPYFFDVVLALRIGKREKKTFRYLQTRKDTLWDAKDRSGTLDKNEPPNLQLIFDKILKGERVDGL